MTTVHDIMTSALEIYSTIAPCIFAQEWKEKRTIKGLRGA